MKEIIFSLILQTPKHLPNHLCFTSNIFLMRIIGTWNAFAPHLTSPVIQEAILNTKPWLY